MIVYGREGYDDFLSPASRALSFLVGVRVVTGTEPLAVASGLRTRLESRTKSKPLIDYKS